MNARLALTSLVLPIALAHAASAPTAHAQAPAAPRVELLDVTVDGHTPPESYRQMFAGAVDAAMAPIVRCYRDRIDAGSRAEGDLRLRLWVSARQVIRTTPEGETLGDAALVTCTRARVLEVRLPDSAPESGATVRFRLRFSGARALAGTTRSSTTTTASTGGASVEAIAPPARVSEETPVVSPRAEVRIDSLRGALGNDLLVPAIPTTAFDACPAGTGSLPLNLTITRRGTLTVAQRTGNTLRPNAARRCVLAAVRALRLPEASGSTRAQITITLSR